MVKILTEGSKQKGYGHIYRCMTITFELDAIVYIDSDTDLTSVFANSVMASWQNVSWVEANINSEDIVVVDSYHVSLDVLEYINKTASKCIVIDDLHRLDYKNFIILNPNNFGDEVNYDKSNIVLGGSKYMLTRKEFSNAVRNSINSQVTNIFVMIGATDILNISQTLYDYFCNDEEFKNINITIVSNEKFEEKNNIRIVNNLDGLQICEYMLNCDFAITAGGQTLNELIKTKTPFTCIEVAANQRSNIDGVVSKAFGMEFKVDELDTIKNMFKYDNRLNFFNNMNSVDYRYNGAYYLKSYLEEDDE